MSIDLNFWKYKKDVYLNNAVVYQKACCENEEIEGLEVLPIEDILKEVTETFCDWKALDKLHYEKKDGQGSFQITATPQTVRFDCYSMLQGELKRFSSMMAKFDCPLYDPQMGERFDKIIVLLRGEVVDYQDIVEQEISRLLPRMEIVTQEVDWPQYMRLCETRTSVQYDAYIHRAKTLTKVISFIKFGDDWANRPCQCKTAQLEDPEKAKLLLTELLKKSIDRVIHDFLDGTLY